MRGLIVLVAATALFLSACYGLRAPPAEAEVVRLELVGFDARPVRAQGYLVEAISRELHYGLGWQVSPQGSAKLQMVVTQEAIDSIASDRDGLPTAWRIRLHGQALFIDRQGYLSSAFTGAGTYTNRGDEPEGFRAAADSAALNLVTWLEGAAARRAPLPAVAPASLSPASLSPASIISETSPQP